MQIQQPKRCRNGRYRFIDEIKINNADSLSKFEEDEYPSKTLESHIVKAIIERNDNYGVPSMLSLKFKLNQNEIFYTMNIPILPTIVDANKRNANFVSDYVHFETDSDIQQKTKDAKRTDKKGFAASAEENAAGIISYIKRELCAKYLLIKRQPNPTEHDIAVMKYLENLSILREFKLGKISPESIIAKKLVSESHIEEPNERETDLYAIMDFSRLVQTSEKPAVYFTYVRGNENIVGLKRGSSAQEVEQLAIADAMAHDNKLGIELINASIFDKYTNGRILKPAQPNAE